LAALPPEANRQLADFPEASYQPKAAQHLPRTLEADHLERSGEKANREKAKSQEADHLEQ
jgi:hypothetical protein